MVEGVVLSHICYSFFPDMPSGFATFADFFLLADSQLRASDRAFVVGYVVLVLGVPLWGYVLAALDFHAYLKSLRRAMVVVAHAVQATPSWVYRDRPPCLTALDLRPPCSEADVLAAYRERVKDLHPDRGGDLRKFLRLQKHFEQALHLVRGQRVRSAGRGC